MRNFLFRFILIYGCIVGNVTMANSTEKSMSMTTQESKVTIRLAGSGTAIIDWGDGIESVTRELSTDLELRTDFNDYTHTYSDTSYHTIIIRGQIITHFD